MKNKELMLEPEIEFIKFETLDIITASSGSGTGTEDDPPVDPVTMSLGSNEGNETTDGYKIARGFSFGNLIK